MNRRDATVAAIGSLMIGNAKAQAATLPVLGLLWIRNNLPVVDEMRAGLRELRLIEGTHYRIDDRYLVDGYEALAGAAQRLVAERVALIVTYGTTAMQAAARATRDIPIVTLSAADPIKAGVAASYARPGGNVTGFAVVGVELQARRLQFLLEIVPRLQRFAVLYYVGSDGEVVNVQGHAAPAQSLGLEMVPVGLRGSDDIRPAVAGLIRLNVQGAVAVGSSLLTAHARTLAEAMAAARTPAVYSNIPIVEAGGLAAYALNIEANFRRAAVYIERILKGARPAEMPIEQTSKIELVVNLKTAHELGLKLPNSVLARADRLIE